MIPNSRILEGLIVVVQVWNLRKVAFGKRLGCTEFQAPRNFHALTNVRNKRRIWIPCKVNCTDLITKYIIEKSLI